MGCGFGGLAWRDGGFRCMEMNKKSGGGDVRAKALSWNGEWDKAKNVFFGFIPLGPARTRSDPWWLAVLATHIPATRKKVGFAEKNFASRELLWVL